MEDLLSDPFTGLRIFGRLFFSGPRGPRADGGSKVFMNRLLGEAPAPILWTINDARSVDPAAGMSRGVYFDRPAAAACTRSKNVSGETWPDHAGARRAGTAVAEGQAASPVVARPGGGERCPSTLDRRGRNHLESRPEWAESKVHLIEAVRIGPRWPGSPKAADFNAFMNAEGRQ